jgi:adenylosuccinate lyase
MVSNLSGDQWNEGDVSCSVVRRVALPDAFFAIDGLLDTFLTVLSQMEVFPAMIEAEVNHYLPFLLSTTIMMEAVKGGAGREDAHSAIKEHAVSTVKELRNGEVKENDLAKRLAGDKRIGLNAEVIQELIKKGQERIGAAHSQVDYFLERADSWSKRYPNATEYQPPSIL